MYASSLAKRVGNLGTYSNGNFRTGMTPAAWTDSPMILEGLIGGNGGFSFAGTEQLQFFFKWLKLFYTYLYAQYFVLIC